MLRLIKKSLVRIEPVNVIPVRSALDIVLGRKPRGVEYEGRSIWSRPFVQYPMLLSDSYLMRSHNYSKDVVFGNELYCGLRPVKHLGEQIYECVVDCVKPIEIGELYVKG